MTGSWRWAIFVQLTLLTADPTMAQPKIVGKANDLNCRVALELATAAFKSDSSSLDWPIAQPASDVAKITLRQNDLDISGGQAVEADGAQFTAIRQSLGDHYSVTTFWAKQSSGGNRLALVDQPHGWRGDLYAVYLLDAAVTPEMFAAQLRPIAEGRESVVAPLLGYQWSIPIILQNERSGEHWLIDRGEPGYVMPDWRVHVVSTTEESQPCRIDFGLHQKPFGELPSAVRRLAAALDEALGPGNDEGTLQQTAGIRIAVHKAWANAALRPWALTDEPYNNPAEIAAGLASWSRANVARTALLHKIERARSSVEVALAAYYSTHLKYSTASARRLSRQAIDHMVRTYFVFSKIG
jgi:hypothetical protein